MNCCPHLEFGMPRFQCLFCSKTIFINDRRVFKVNSVIVRTGMICNPKGFGQSFDIFSNVATRTIGTRNFVNGVCLQIQAKVETSGPELLL